MHSLATPCTPTRPALLLLRGVAEVFPAERGEAVVLLGITERTVKVVCSSTVG
jgi:hypothetical protein